MASPRAFLHLWRVGYALVLFTVFARARLAISLQLDDAVIVKNGYELHAALASSAIRRIFLANNVELSVSTSPLQANDAWSATQLSRNITIASLPASAATNISSNNSNGTGQSAASSGAVPYTLNCSYLTDRFAIKSGFKVTLSHIVLINCHTYSPVGFFRKAAAATLSLDSVIDNRGSVCLPVEQYYASLTGSGQNGSSSGSAVPAVPAPYQQGQQLAQLAPPGSDWCAQAAAGNLLLLNSSSNSSFPGFQSLLPANSSTPLCQQQAVVLSRVAFQDVPADASSSIQAKPYIFEATNSVVLCPQPVAEDCIRQSDSAACVTAAFDAVNPDSQAPCLATDGHSMQACLQNSSHRSVLMLQSVSMNLSTSPAQRQPTLIDRNVTIMADPRGPRLAWDCGFLSNRFQLQPNYTLTLHHIILTNCTSARLFTFIRISAGATMVFNDTFVVSPPLLCVPPPDRPPVQGPPQARIDPRAVRPAELPAVQDMSIEQPHAGPTQWCEHNASVTGAYAAYRPDSAGSSSDAAGVGGSVGAHNLSMFGNTTGFGPPYAATLTSPAPVPYFVHLTWPGTDLCTALGPPPFLLKDFAEYNPLGWIDESSNATATPVAPAVPQTLPARPADANILPQQLQPSQPPKFTAGQQKLLDQLQHQKGPRFGSDLDYVNGSYSGSFIMWYINTSIICTQPELNPGPPGAGSSGKCGSSFDGAICASLMYESHNPDRLMVPGAAAYESALLTRALDGASAGASHTYGTTVVLPAVLASVVGAILACILALLVIQRKRQQASKRSAKTAETTQAGSTTASQQQSCAADAATSPRRHLKDSRQAAKKAVSWLSSAFGVAASQSSTDPTRQLLQGTATTAATTSTTTSSDRANQRGFHSAAAPDGIALGPLIGAGSFGRVYAGSWNAMPVAVKIITHSSKDDDRIMHELVLSMAFNHPNLVRALHCSTTRINESNTSGSQGQSGSTSQLLPEGAVGVFTWPGLPTNWAVVQHMTAEGQHGAPAIDTETWIVMDLMDRGNMAAALRHTSMFLDTKTGGLNMAKLLRRAADVAAGLAYLHSRNVCHGDLKWENVLLKTDQNDPDGLTAIIADFGLSRALAYGQSHLSTRRYGTVTHMPPELLVAGKLTPAADVYSFGIMMWELASRSLPFQGLHHGEIIHRVVTEDLRPGPWPEASIHLQLPADFIPLAEACWCRQASLRPSMMLVAQRLLNMLAEIQGTTEQ